MNRILTTATPLILFILGLLLLFLLNLPVPAGVVILLGYVMIIERIWPEKWESEKKDSSI